MDLIISNEKKNCKCKKRCERNSSAFWGTVKMDFSGALSEFDTLGWRSDTKIAFLKKMSLLSVLFLQQTP